MYLRDAFVILVVSSAESNPEICIVGDHHLCWSPGMSSGHIYLGLSSLFMALSKVIRVMKNMAVDDISTMLVIASIANGGFLGV